jgi:hypothetical protein
MSYSCVGSSRDGVPSVISSAFSLVRLTVIALLNWSSVTLPKFSDLGAIEIVPSLALPLSLTVSDGSSLALLVTTSDPVDAPVPAGTKATST